MEYILSTKYKIAGLGLQLYQKMLPHKYFP